MDKRRYVLEQLNKAGVAYEMAEHPPAFTMEDIEAFGVNRQGNVCKNLFLRDAKGRRHFVVTVDGDKQVDLKALGNALGTRLSFGSAERLNKVLQLQKGEVTPLGAMLDDEGAVEIYLDRDLQGQQRLGMHPCDNSATLFMSFDGLVAALQYVNHPPPSSVCDFGAVFPVVCFIK